MHRFYLPPHACTRRPLCLTGAEAHHAVRVLRLRPGDALTVLDGCGRQFHCEIAAAHSKNVELTILREQSSPPSPASVTLFQALPKHKTWDALLAKATELGVSRIVAVLTEHTVPHLDAGRQQHQRARWQQAVIEACKQCGQPWLPQVLGPLSWTSALALWLECELHLAGLLATATRRVHDHLADFLRTQRRLPATVGLWIGPEGDFSPSEVTDLLTRGVHPITLGPLVLRVDTAALAALALLQDELRAAAPSAQATTGSI